MSCSELTDYEASWKCNDTLSLRQRTGICYWAGSRKTQTECCTRVSSSTGRRTYQQDHYLPALLRGCNCAKVIIQNSANKSSKSARVGVAGRQKWSMQVLSLVVRSRITDKTASKEACQPMYGNWTSKKAFLSSYSSSVGCQVARPQLAPSTKFNLTYISEMLCSCMSAMGASN